MEEVDIELSLSEQKEIQFKKDSKRLKKIICEAFGVDIMDNSRLQKVVDSRRVFLKILDELGYTLSAIGKEVNRDHSTMHHFKKNYYIFDYDVNLAKKYLECREAFFEGSDIVSRNQSEKLILDKYSVIKMQQKYKRLSKIIDIIDRVTYEGREDLMEQRIRDMIKRHYYGETEE